jgi:hypothetical protein
MTTGSACSRSWQAEAAEDLRLSDADRASFERHLATCSVCCDVVRELAQLRSLAARTEAPPSSALEHRRSKNELLRRANELTLEAPRGRSLRFLVVAAAIAVLALAVLVGLRRNDHGSPPDGTRAEPSYELVASPGADWAPLVRGPALKLAVRRGRFELSVRHLAPGQRFVLALPDGELEVQGTRFVVEVDGSRTLGVRVEEGRVALRVRERSGELLLLGAGESFATSTKAMPNEGSTPPPIAEPSVAATPPASASRPPPRASASAPAGSGVAVPKSSAGHDATADGTSSVEFASAMGAFSSGNFGQAEKLFRTFAARHPTDQRAEDATFLAAVASARRGDHENARLLAERYLARYPNGLRRREAARLAK